MKRLIILAIAFWAVLGFVTLAQAGPIPGTQHLYDNGGGLIYDADFNITWYDVANNTGLYWSDTNSWVAGLTLGGESGWRLPTAMNKDGTGPCWTYNCTGGEIGHLFYTELGNLSWPQPGFGLKNKGPFSNLNSSAPYWESPATVNNGAWAFLFMDGSQFHVWGACYALAVHDGDIGPNGPISTPEPTTILLLGLGLIGLAGVRRKFKN